MALTCTDMSDAVAGSDAEGLTADAIVVGAGLAGLVAACELADRGLRVLILDQENRANVGGQAFWSFGGLFLVNSPEQRRLGIRDSHELALQDWLGTAAFDRPEDYWPEQWAHAYVDFAAGEKRSWLRAHRLTDPKAGPLIAVKLHILTRKTLGGIETDLDARVLKADGTPLAGLYAAGEVAGFGGGGVHGYRALEGTFLGGCIFSGRAAGRGAAEDIR